MSFRAFKFKPKPKIVSIEKRSEPKPEKVEEKPQDEPKEVQVEKVAPPEVEEVTKSPEKPKRAFKPKISTNDRNEKSKFTTSTYGKMSNEARQQMMKKFGTLTPERCKLTMLDLIYFNPKDNPMKSKKKKEPSPVKEIEEKLEEEKVDEEGLDMSGIPQLKVNEDGTVSIAPESLILKKDIVETRSIIDEDEFTKRRIVKRHHDRQKWTFEETVKFYKALNSIGSDFETMKTIFTDRSRKSLKRKFKREERVNGRLVDKMLGTPYSKFDLEKLKEELAVGDEFHSKTSKRSNSDPERKNIIEEVLSEQIKTKKPIKRKSLKSVIAGESKRKKPKTPEPLTPESSETSDSESIVQVNNDNIVINTNFNINGITYTKSVTYSVDDLDNPIDVNETIAHIEPEETFNDSTNVTIAHVDPANESVEFVEPTNETIAFVEPTNETITNVDLIKTTVEPVNETIVALPEPEEIQENDLEYESL